MFNGEMVRAEFMDLYYYHSRTLMLTWNERT
jgi:hypothetical protein